MTGPPCRDSHTMPMPMRSSAEPARACPCKRPYVGPVTFTHRLTTATVARVVNVRRHGDTATTRGSIGTALAKSP